MNKKQLSERDICTRFIVPAITSAGWDIQDQVREEYFFTAGQLHVRGKTVKRGKRKFADFLLSWKPNIPLAIIEAKDNNHSVGSGMQQGLDYARTLDIPFVFSTNGERMRQPRSRRLRLRLSGNERRAHGMANWFARTKVIPHRDFEVGDTGRHMNLTADCADIADTEKSSEHHCLYPRHPRNSRSESIEQCNAP